MLRLRLKSALMSLAMGPAFIGLASAADFDNPAQQPNPVPGLQRQDMDRDHDKDHGNIRTDTDRDRDHDKVRTNTDFDGQRDRDHDRDDTTHTPIIPLMQR